MKTAHSPEPIELTVSDVTTETTDFSNRTVANMVIVMASQDWYSGNTSWKEQVETNTLSFYDAGRENLDNLVRPTLR